MKNSGRRQTVYVFDVGVDGYAWRASVPEDEALAEWGDKGLFVAPSISVAVKLAIGAVIPLMIAIGTGLMAAFILRDILTSTAMGFGAGLACVLPLAALLGKVQPVGYRVITRKWHPGLEPNLTGLGGGAIVDGEAGTWEIEPYAHSARDSAEWTRPVSLSGDGASAQKLATPQVFPASAFYEILKARAQLRLFSRNTGKRDKAVRIVSLAIVAVSIFGLMILYGIATAKN